MSSFLPRRTKSLLLIYLFEISFLFSVYFFKYRLGVSWVLLASSPKDSPSSPISEKALGEIPQVKGTAFPKRYLWGTLPCPKTQRIISPGAKENLLEGEGKTNRCLKPSEIILHWSESPAGNAVTYEALEKRGLSCQLAVDEREVWQLLDFYPTLVEVSFCAGDWERNLRSINIELAGDDFDNTPPPDSELEKSLTLVCWLLEQYQIPRENIFGHFQIVEEKKDPGERFLEEFKGRVKRRCF